MNLQPEDQFIVAEDILSQQVHGETVLLDLNGDVYFGLNEVGTKVWTLLQSRHTLASLVTDLHASYEVSTIELEADIKALIGDLLNEKLLSRV